MELKTLQNSIAEHDKKDVFPLKEDRQKFPVLRGRKNFPMDREDRLILNAIQRNFPVTHRPFLALGRKLGMKEKEVLDRVQRLKEAGIIRLRCSAPARWVQIHPVRCQSPRQKIEEFVAAVNSYPGVTHNYERKGITTSGSPGAFPKTD
jgi:DNA-binding Lrp family transcriptional regulator